MSATFPPVRIPDPWEDHDDSWRQLRAEIEADFHQWQRDGIRGLSECDNNPREDVDMEDWLETVSQPHMVDWERYAAARLTDAELAAHSRDQRKFARENRA